jgi:hypothetical protein
MGGSQHQKKTETTGTAITEALWYTPVGESARWRGWLFHSAGSPFYFCVSSFSPSAVSSSFLLSIILSFFLAFLCL